MHLRFEPWFLCFFAICFFGREVTLLTVLVLQHCAGDLGMQATAKVAEKSKAGHHSVRRSYMHSQAEQDVVEERMAPDPCIERAVVERFLYNLELDLSLLPPDAA